MKTCAWPWKKFKEKEDKESLDLARLEVTFEKRDTKQLIVPKIEDYINIDNVDSVKPSTAFSSYNIIDQTNL